MPADTEAVADEFLSEKLRAQLTEKGEVDLAYSVPSLGRFRVNVFQQRGSIAVAARVLNVEIPSPAALAYRTASWKSSSGSGARARHRPTGSGKSTTLASLINVLNENYSYHIITLEDPIEYLHRHKKSIVNQREMGSDTYSFASGLRAALREDPTSSSSAKCAT
jgi:twitching motility protein PilT